MKLVSITLGIDIPCLSFYLGFAKTKLCCGRHIAQVMKNSTIAKVNKKLNVIKDLQCQNRHYMHFLSIHH